MPVLLACIISGPAVLSCSSVDCEKAAGWTRLWALLCAGMCLLVPGSAALGMCSDELGKWADSYKACKQKMERDQ